MSDNRCGCHRHRGCNICGFFNGFGRRRGDCFNNDFGYERYERCERFERFDNCGNFCNCNRIGDGRRRDELTRADFDGFFPEARIEKVKRNCCCKR